MLTTISARTIRPILISALLVFSIGLVAYSLACVRHPIDSSPANELTVTELSLTHEIERSPDGGLRMAGYEDAEEQVIAPQESDETDSKTPVVAKSAEKKKPSVKKPAPKKPQPKKPAPKKPAPKKPDEDGRKPCPT